MINRSIKCFSIYLLTAALFSLALILPGCSDGDRSLNNAGDDVSGAVVNTLVGLVNTQAKGIDFPSTTVELDVSFVHDGLEVVRKRFAETASGDIAAWTPYSDGIVALRSELTESEVSVGVLSVVVYAYDEAGELLGVGCMDGITPAAGKTVTADFTLPSSPEFISIDTIAKNADLALTTDPVAGDDGITVIPEGGSASVAAELLAAVSDTVTISLPVADDEYTLSTATETASIAIDNDNKVIMGISATEEPAEITAVCDIKGETKTASCSISVSSDEPVPPTPLTAAADAEVYTIGDTITLTVSCGNEDIAYGDYSVSLSDAALVTDNGDGTFTAVAAGTETFTISYAEQTAEVKAVIAAADELTAKLFNADGEEATSFAVDDAITVKAYRGADELTFGTDFTVSLSDAALVADNGDGTFTAVAAGTETFTISYDDQTAEVKAVIEAAEEHELSIQLLGDCCVYQYSDLGLPAGIPDNTVDIAVYYDGEELSNDDFELSVDNEDIAEYDGDGTLYLFKPGKASLTVSHDGCSATHEITVSKEDLLSLPTRVHPREGTYPEVFINGQYVDPSECVITSDAPGFNVEDDGFIYFPNSWSSVSELTVNCEYGGKSLSQKVSIVPFKLYIVNNDHYMDEDVISSVGETMRLYALYSDGTSIPYESYQLAFDKNFVRDNQDGTISFIAAGKTQVTASYQGNEYSIDVDIKSLKAELKGEDLPFEIDDTATLDVTYNGTVLGPGDYDLAISDETLLKDNGDGTFTWLAEGTVALTVKYGSKTAIIGYWCSGGHEI